MVQPIGQLDRARTYRASTLTSHSLVVERVIRAMQARLSEPLSLEEMAEIACLSPFHFNRIFRAITGIPPGEFLAALRMDAAKRLVLTTSLSVTDVCFDLGYASLGTFVKRFKEMVGLSPLQLRQLAEDFTPASLEPLFLDGYGEARSLVAVPDRGVRGAITAPGRFAGVIFAGLFPKPIPQHCPVACVHLTVPGRFQIEPVPDGRYYLLAAALPWSPSPLSYLMPQDGLLVAASQQPVLVHGGRSGAPVNLALRPLQVADPPILGVFPSVLAAPSTSRNRNFI